MRFIRHPRNGVRYCAELIPDQANREVLLRSTSLRYGRFRAQDRLECFSVCMYVIRRRT